MLPRAPLISRVSFPIVPQTIYGPTGLRHTTDQQLMTLLTDIRAWRANLPPPLRFTGPQTSSFPAGILHIYYTAVNFLFFRVFMRISYQCPAHLQFCLDVETWSALVQWSSEAIDWLDLNDHALDTSFTVSYATTSVALVQVGLEGTSCGSSALKR